MSLKEHLGAVDMLGPKLKQIKKSALLKETVSEMEYIKHIKSSPIMCKRGLQREKGGEKLIQRQYRRELEHLTTINTSCDHRARENDTR